MTCSTLKTINIIGKKWTIIIIEELGYQKRIGFGKLIKSVYKVSPKILSQRLKQLEKEGLVKKYTEDEKGSKKISYELTEKGRKLKKITEDLKDICMSDKKIKRCTECPMY